jgi:hypothetical protein
LRKCLQLQRIEAPDAQRYTQQSANRVDVGLEATRRAVQRAHEAGALPAGRTPGFLFVVQQRDLVDVAPIG